LPTPDVNTALIVPSRTLEDRAVTVSDGFSMSSIYRAISVLSTSVKQLTLDAVRSDTVLASKPALLRQPNIDQPLSAFLEETVVSLACAGNAYWLLERGSTGAVTNVQVLNPLDIIVDTTPWGRVTGYQYKSQRFAPEQIKHLKLLRVPGSAKGLGPIQAAQVELRGALDVRDFAGNWFPKSGVPGGGYLSTDQVLNPDQAKAFKTAWAAATAERDGAPVLGNGLTYNQTFLSPSDALWIDAQQFSITQVSRLFGIPSSLMLAAIDGTSQVYANVEQELGSFLKFTLTGYLSEIEQALSALLPKGTDVRFNVEGLLRSDTATRYAAHAVALSSGFMTINEVREIENLPPLPEPAPSAPSAPTSGDQSALVPEPAPGDANV
jgi:HK97 family phage portal protein